MSKINLTSKKWNDLVFEGRNKNYGAYDMRRNSNKRHIIALLIILAAALLAFYLPMLIKSIIPEKEEEIKMTEVTELSKLPPAEEKQEEVKQEEVIIAPPPPALKSTLKFTAPVIKKDEEVSKEDEMIDQTEMAQSDDGISSENFKGTDGDDAVFKKDVEDMLGGGEEEKKPEPEPEKTYTTVEQMPSYPGGETELIKYLAKSLKYPKIAEENGIQGTVIVSFVVAKTGKVENVQIYKSLEKSCDNEAIRVVSGMKDWIPGKQNGINVRVFYTLPIRFKL